MSMSLPLLVFVLIFFITPSWAAGMNTPSASASEHRDWHVSANIAYTSRTLDGSINNRSAIADDVFGELVATGDSMDLDTSQSLMYTLAIQYKKWGLKLNYAPTSFSGQGFAIVELTGSSAGVLQKTPLNTDIEVDLLLGKLTYDIIQSKSSRFGVGVGLGTSYVDLSIIPDAGNSIIYDGRQPFGYLSVFMANNYNQFLYGFSLNAISATFSGDEVDYSDYTVEVGYRLSDDGIKWDLVGGYRLVNFTIDIEDGQDLIKAITHLQGPFIGVNATY